MVDQIKRLWMVSLASLATLWIHQVQAAGFLKHSPEVESVSPSVLQSEVVQPSENSHFASLEATAPAEMSMIEAVQRAVNWNPQVYESVSALFQQQQNVRSARSGYYPQLSVGVVAGHDTENNSNGNGQAIQIYASQVLYDFGKVSSEIDREAAGAKKSQAEVLESIDKVARDTAKAAIEVQRYQALLETAQEQINGVSAITRLVTMRSDRGASSRSDVLQAESRMEAARASKQRVMAELNRWKSTLESLMGVGGPFMVSMDTPEAVSSACLVESPKVSGVPEILIAEASREEAVARLKEAKSNAWPTLSLDASVNSYLDQDYVDANALNDHESAVFLNMSMPIYQGGRISAGKDSAAYALQSADAAIDSARLSVMRNYRAAQEQASGLRVNLPILDSRERAISKTRDIYRKQYSSLGTRTLLDLLNAEQELHQARVERKNTEYDLAKLYIDCLYNVGKIRQAFQLEGSEIQGVEVLP